MVLANSLVQERNVSPLLAAHCFWKDPKDVCSGFKTCRQLSNQPTVNTEDYEYYLKKNNVYSNGFCGWGSTASRLEPL